MREQQEVPNGLADEIEQRIDDRLSGDGGAAPLSQIDDFENVSADTIRVLVQATLSPSDREELASALFAESGTDALSTVLVVDGTGEESEHRQ